MSSLACAGPISALHDVELQLILHGLSVRDIIAVARCSRRMLVAASDPFGWKCCPAMPILLRAIPLDAAGLAARCAPLCASWRYLSEMVAIQALAGRCRINCLVIHLSYELTQAHAATMLAGLALHAVVEQLYLSFTPSSPISPELMQAISEFPRLRFLSLSNAASTHPDLFALLATGACSRTLRQVRWDDNPHDHRCLANCMAQLSSLTAVTILRPDLYHNSFRNFFTSPNLAALQSITLVEFQLRGRLKTQRYNRRDYRVGPTLEDFVAVFTSLTQLTWLTLVECEGLGALLPVLIHSASLRQLIIQPDCNPSHTRWNSTFPKKSTLQWLLSNLPQLFATLHIPSPRWAGPHAKNVARQREMFAGDSDALTSRYRLSSSAVDGLDEPFHASSLY